jgi:hypothetical protein
MAQTYNKGIAASFIKTVILPILTGVLVFESCKSEQKTYKSNCNDNVTFKHVDFTRLIDSIKNYDQQYIEVVGTYVEGKDESALVNDSTFVDHSNDHSLWVNFSQDCPLYLAGTHTGLFEYNDGTFTQINNKKITIRGKIDVRHKGHLGSYKGTIDRVSFVKL